MTASLWKTGPSGSTNTAPMHRSLRLRRPSGSPGCPKTKSSKQPGSTPPRNPPLSPRAPTRRYTTPTACRTTGPSRPHRPDGKFRPPGGNHTSQSAITRGPRGSSTGARIRANPPWTEMAPRIGQEQHPVWCKVTSRRRPWSCRFRSKAQNLIPSELFWVSV